MKVLLIFFTLLFCVFTNLFLPRLFNLLPLTNFAAHFLIAGILLSYFVAEFWIWFDRESFFQSKPFLKILGILAGDSLCGVFWEIFEYWYSQGLASIGNGEWFYRDTIWDFQMNFLGALIVALLYCRKL